jgi:hypothetical protein
MIKLNSSQEFPDGSIRLLDLDKPYLEKEAAQSDIMDFVSTIKPVPGRSYFHISVLGSMEHWGPTKNADAFPEESLIKYHKTFENALLYKGHRNKKDSPSFGRVVYSTYNTRMRRIEVVAEADEPTTIEINNAIAQGRHPLVSMACKIPYDICNQCFNKASTRSAYCKHLSQDLNKMYPNGNKVFSINKDNINWFDVSIVIRPAFLGASVLTKVADDSNIREMGAAELAEIEGYTEKKAQIKKWSEIVKEIQDSGQVLNDITSQVILAKTQDLPTSIIPTLARHSLNQILTALACLGISPSISFLSELIARIHLGEGYEGIGPIVEEYTKHAPGDAMTQATEFEAPLEPIDPMLISILLPYVGNSSLLSSAIEKRASGVGYAHNGPYIEPTYQEEQAALLAAKPHADNFEISYGKLLLGLGASALLAKWFISNEINKQRNENYAKIVLHKRAEYHAAATLSKASFPNFTQEDAEKEGLSMTRRILKSTKTGVGNKLAAILKLVGLGQKVKETLIQ